MRCRHFMLAVLFTVVLVFSAVAQSRTNLSESSAAGLGEPELTVCGQNLANYGTFEAMKRREVRVTVEKVRQKEEALIERFLTAKCDVIAVQELLGKNEEVSLEALNGLAAKLKRRTNRTWEAKTGPSNDPYLRLGYLVAKDRAKVLNVLSYAKVELPKIIDEEKPRFFPRGPLEIQLEVPGRGDSYTKTVTLVTFHFKSKRGEKGDPAGLEWETYRIEMAEALRRVVESRHKRAFASGDTLLILLGDRNSHFDAASAKVLDGVLSLKHFKKDGACRLSKRGVPLCQAGATLPQRLFSILTGDPQTKLLHGTFVYQGVFSWIDDILMPAENLRFAWVNENNEGDYDSGVIYEPRQASDHALVYVRLNW